MAKTTPRWLLAALASVMAFVIGVLGCAAKAWHAPEVAVIVGIYVVGVAVGFILAAMDRPQRIPASQVLRVPSAGSMTLLFAAILGAVTAGGGAALVAMAIDHVEPLVFASLLGSLWMATYPLHPMVARRLLETEVALGLDGIRVRRTVIPYRDVGSVSARGHTLAIERRSGERIERRLPNEELARTFADRITERAATARAGGLRIGRQGRSLDAWKRELVSPDYRAAAISSEEAAKILEAGAATPDERIGAALVLAKAGEQQRIRVSAAACVEPAVRSALERVADDTLDEDAVTRATARDSLPRG